MKDLMRTLVGAVVGAVVAIAVVVGQPALAGQVEKAKAKKITSAAIKNGTIKTKDLNTEVTGPLAKAGTALQSVPDGSVTSAKIADGSLSAADIGTSTGSVPFDTPPLGNGVCVGALPQVDTGHNLDNDLILVSHPPAVASALQISGLQLSPGSSVFSIFICNLGATGGVVDPPLVSFSYAVISN
jgi:hypothetical protein